MGRLLHPAGVSAPAPPALQEADDAFGTIQYALAQQLQPLEEEDPEFVSTWMSNLAETRGAFMERVSTSAALST